MKNNYKLLLIALVAMVGFASCGKDDDTKKDSTSEIETGLEVGADGKTYLISKIKRSDTEYGAAEYDDKGRLTKYSNYHNGEVEYYTTVKYSGNTVTLTENYSEGGKYTVVATLGENGYAKTAVSKETYTEGEDTYNYESTSQFTYNSDGYLIKTVESDKETSDNPDHEDETSTSITEFTYSNGNLVSSVTTYGDGNSYALTFEYYTDKDYSPVLDIEDLRFLFGKASKNLVKKKTEVEIYDGHNYNGETNYTYTFNDDGLPITVSTNGDTKTIEYIVK